MTFMIRNAFFLILTLSLGSCSALRFSSDKGAKSSKSVVNKEQFSKRSNQSLPLKTAVWELLNQKEMKIHLRNVDSGKKLTVNLLPGISPIKIPSGHWELAGLSYEGTSYNSMNTSKKFIFRMHSDVNIYAGSILFDCPKIASEKISFLKRMEFFNRYPFNSSTGLCEVIVGNNFNEVSSSIRKSRKFKGLNLKLGF